MTKNSRLGQFTICYLLGVIAWGAFVRASGSGAGCGSHWPLCNGQIFPKSGSTKTFIEFTHRITSGLSLILCIAYGWQSIRNKNQSYFSKRAGIATIIFILLEALLGAGLVLLELVADNPSLLRAVSLAIHLMNTFLLLAAVTLALRWNRQESQTTLQWRPIQHHLGLLFASILAVLGTLVLGSSGAMTALGDTLFPSSNLSTAFAEDLSPTSHFLIQLRILHPLFAVTMGSYLLYFSWFLNRRFSKKIQDLTFFSSLLALSLIAQMLLGGVNILLMAPTAIQMTHLLLADLIWILLVQMLAAIWVLPSD